MLTGDDPGSALRLSGDPFQAQREPFSLPPRLHGWLILLAG